MLMQSNANDEEKTKSKKEKNKQKIYAKINSRASSTLDAIKNNKIVQLAAQLLKNYDLKAVLKNISADGEIKKIGNLKENTADSEKQFAVEDVAFKASTGSLKAVRESLDVVSLNGKVAKLERNTLTSKIKFALNNQVKWFEKDYLDDENSHKSEPKKASFLAGINAEDMNHLVERLAEEIKKDLGSKILIADERSYVAITEKEKDHIEDKNYIVGEVARASDLNTLKGKKMDDYTGNKIQLGLSDEVEKEKATTAFAKMTEAFAEIDRFQKNGTIRDKNKKSSIPVSKLSYLADNTLLLKFISQYLPRCSPEKLVETSSTLKLFLLNISAEELKELYPVICKNCMNIIAPANLSCGHLSCIMCLKSNIKRFLKSETEQEKQEAFSSCHCEECRANYSVSDYDKYTKNKAKVYCYEKSTKKCLKCNFELEYQLHFLNVFPCLDLCYNCHVDLIGDGVQACPVCNKRYKGVVSALKKEVVCCTCNSALDFDTVICFKCSDSKLRCQNCILTVKEQQASRIGQHCFQKFCVVCYSTYPRQETFKKYCCGSRYCEGHFDLDCRFCN